MQTAAVKRRRVLLVVAAIFIAAIGAVVLWPGEKEPQYQGRKLSEWLGIAYDLASDSREEQQISQYASNSLWKIAPEVLTNRVTEVH